VAALVWHDTPCRVVATLRVTTLLIVPILFVTLSARAADAPLADVAEKRNFSDLKELLERRADVNVAQADGMTALHWAVYHDRSDTVQDLLSAGADAMAKTRYGVTPLSIACTNGNVKIVVALLEAGADPNAILAGGETPLMTASRTGRIEPVKALLDRGAKVDAKDRNGQTAVMWAAADGHVDVVSTLIDAGADFKTPLPSGYTPLFFAVREGQTEVVRRLLAAGIDVNEPMHAQGGGRRPLSPLLLAVENGHFELAVALLDAGADPNAQPAGFAALHAISWVRKPLRGDGNPPPIGSGKLSSLEFVRTLLERGADVNLRLKRGKSGRAQFTTTGSTPFLLACWTSDVPLMQLLLDRGADPTLTNEDGSTPLVVAAGIGDLGSGDELGGTEEEAVAAIRLLLKLGADVNAVDENGETAMHGAAYQNRPQVVRLLAEHGADTEAWHRKNKWGWTPLMIARGYRLGNFRPSPETVAAIEDVLKKKSAEAKSDRDEGR
jgi:uncharacterized protein